MQPFDDRKGLVDNITSALFVTDQITQVYSIVVEEREFLNSDKILDVIRNFADHSYEFLPMDEFLLNKRVTGGCVNDRSAVFFAKINNREVARAGMFLRNHAVIIGGSTDFSGAQDLEVRRALLKAIESRSRFLGASSVSLYTPGFSLTSIALYKTLGYYFSGQRKLINGAAVLHMEKRFE